MASSTSSSSSTSSLGIGGNRMSGLATGLDTEALVKAMATNTKTRLNRQQQQLDRLSWTQDAYREVIKKIQGFQDTFLTTSAKDTCLKLPSLFKQYAGTASNSKVTVSASNNASSTSYSISKIQQLAKKAELTSSGAGVTRGAKIDLSGLDGSKEYSVNLTLDGLSKDITFSTEEEFMNAVKSNFGEGFSYSDGNLSYTANDGVSHTYTVQAAKNTYSSLVSSERIQKQNEALRTIGIEGDGVSNKARGSSKLSELNLSTELVGNNFSFTINGESFSFDKDATINSIINTVNDSNAGVTMKFDTLSQKFTINSDEEGANSQINIEQTGGNLLTALGFGVGGSSVSSKSLKGGSITGSNADTSNLNAFKNEKYTVTINGKSATVVIPNSNTSGDAYDFVDDEDMTKEGARSAGDKFAEALNQYLKNSEIGTEASFSYDKESGKFSLNGKSTSDVVSITSDNADLMNALGFTQGQTNEITESTLASELIGKTGTITVGSTQLEITESTTMGEIKSALESNGDGTVDFATGTISINSAVTATGDDNIAFAEELFGTDYSTLSNAANYSAGGSSTLSATGQNAIVTVNGTTISNSSNTITVDGTSIYLGNLSEAEAANVDDLNTIEITTTRDTTKAKDAIVQFVNEYNKLIEELNETISTKRPKSSGSYYDPLTEEQEEEMSEDEIADWNEQAKIGLLYQDSSISKFLTKMRNTMLTTSESGFSLADLGIKESDNWRDRGKLIIDEEKLNLALEENADEVCEFFTDTTNGFAAKVQESVDSAISTSRTKGYGTLARMAGIESTATATSNTLSTKITSLQEIIDALKERYQKELDRYWEKFTRLETYTAQYSSISSMFTSY